MFKGGKRNYLKKQILAGAGIIMAMYAFLRFVSRREAYSEKEIDKDNPYIVFHHAPSKGEISKKPRGRENGKKDDQNVYEQIIKPKLDRILSFLGLIVLSPVFGVIALAIVLDDPGPVLFKQKRVGKDCHFFYLHKFRSMKMSAPHDLPTHELDDPDQYITKVGKILRGSSLDEIVQIYDIWRGCMSIIGPRPALWNQEDLVAARSGKVDANRLKPGLTGLAQISGRDKLGIRQKAEWDKKYAKILRSGSLAGISVDIRCFFWTIISVVKRDGIVEGRITSANKAKHKEKKRNAGAPDGTSTH